jgi:hypothetical protein
MEDYKEKRQKSCESHIQDVCNSIKKPNQRVMGIEEGEDMQVNSIRNIVNKIIAENFSNLEKKIPIQAQEASRTSNRPDQNRTSPYGIL